MSGAAFGVVKHRPQGEHQEPYEPNAQHEVAIGVECIAGILQQ